MSDMLLTYANSLVTLFESDVLRELLFGILALVPIKAFLLIIKH